MPQVYQNQDGSYTVVPDGGAPPFRAPVAPTGTTPKPFLSKVSDAIASLAPRSKSPTPVPPPVMAAPPAEEQRQDVPGEVIVTGPEGTEQAIPAATWAKQATRREPSESSRKLLIVRPDGNFDAVATSPWGTKGTQPGIFSMSEPVDAPTAIQMRDTEGYQVLGEGDFARLADEDPELHKALTLSRNPTAAPSEAGPDRLRQGVAQAQQAGRMEQVRQQGFPGFKGDPARMGLTPEGTWAAPTQGPTGTPAPATPAEQKIADEAAARNAQAERIRQNPLESFFQQPAEAQPSATGAAAATGGTKSAGFTPKKTDLGLKDFEEAERLKAEALGAAQSFEEGQAQRKRLAMEQAMAQEEKLQAEQQELERIRQERVGEATAKLQGMLEESMQPGGQVDPGRWWNSRSTGQKVAAVLGQALASFASGMRGGGPVDMLSKYVDDDIRLQQEELARADAKQRSNLEAQGKVLALTEKRYGDPVQAKAAARALVWDNMARQLELREAQVGTEAAKAKYAGLKAQLAGEAARARSDLLLRTEQLHLQQSANAREWAAVRLQEQASKNAAAAKAAAFNFEKVPPGTPIPIAALTEDLKKRALPLGNGTAVLALDDKRAEEAAKKLDTTASLLEKVGQLRQLRSELGSTITPSNLKQMRGIQKEIIVEYGRAKGLGALDNGTIAVGEAITGGDPGAWGFGIDDAIASFGERIAQDRMRTISSATGAAPANLQLR